LTYIYVYTADKKKFERIKKAVEVAKTLDETPVFCVNDLEAIEEVNKNGFKAMNVDALQDLFNVSDGSDVFYISTPEDTAYLKAAFANVKEI
jgi:methionine synthase I (cobalamin-dependent)